MATATSTLEYRKRKISQAVQEQQNWFRFELITVVLSFWYIGGLFIDGWAHNHGRTDESFFTIWHAVFYSGFAVVAAFYAYTVWTNVNRGKAWSQALPEGHHLSLIGIVIFALGGGADMIWHEVFGIEEDIEALLSPSHLTLALGMILVFSGSFRAFLHRQKTDGKWVDWLTPTLSMAFTVSVMMFILQYLSPTGSPIGFYFPENEANANLQVYRMNTDGTEQTRLFPTFDESLFHMNVSPDGDKVVYASGELGEFSTIFVADTDGTNAQAITDTESNNLAPAWSPDGTQIAYTSNRSGSPEIYVFNLETGEETRLTENDSLESFPAWSPDGTQIAYTSGFDATAEIYVMDADGSNPVQITDNDTWESFAQWSPGGETLAISREVGDSSAIVVINLDGEDVTQLTDSEVSSYFPVWSNDGESLIYTQFSDNGEDIMSISLESGEITNLTNNPVLQESYAQVTADGSIIYRVRGNEGTVETDDANDLLLIFSLSSMIISSALVVGGMMLLLREGRPPFGAMTLFWTGIYLLIATQDDGYIIVPLATGAGLLSDILIRVLDVRMTNTWRFIGFAFAIPALFFAVYFGLFEYAQGISWSVDVWTGSIVLAGASGALIAYLVQSGTQSQQNV